MAHQVLAPMAGSIYRIECVEGSEAAPDTILIIMESMKMEVPVEAGMAGKVSKIHCNEGDIVDYEQVLVVLD